MKEGFSNILKGSSPHHSSKNQTAGSPIFTARVNGIILSDKDEGWKENGEYASIGYIYFNNPVLPNNNQKNIARPLFSNSKYYPILNELVYLIGLPSTDISKNPASLTYYYSQPINIWNSNHHNAIPDEIFTQQLPDSQKQDYKTVGLGVVRQVTDESTEIDLGFTFKEKPNIKTLQPYEGDYILEGRWGNSLRFGSTVTNGTPSNTWSSTGNNGDPLIILRNGQYENGLDPWIPIIEDINQDSGSIYLTSTQKINLNPASQTYNSYSTQPKGINQYINPQIILNSGRLVFNAKTDSIIALANKSIQLSSRETVGIDATQIALTADKVYLGASEGVEGTNLQSAVLGENLIQQLSSLVTGLKSLATSISNAVDSNGAPISDFIVVGTSLKATCDDILKVLNKKPNTNGSLLSNKIKIRQ